MMWCLDALVPWCLGVLVPWCLRLGLATTVGGRESQAQALTLTPEHALHRAPWHLACIPVQVDATYVVWLSPRSTKPPKTACTLTSSARASARC